MGVSAYHPPAWCCLVLGPSDRSINPSIDRSPLQVSEDAPSGLGQVHRLLHVSESHGLGASSSTAIRRAAGAAAW